MSKGDQKNAATKTEEKQASVTTTTKKHQGFSFFRVLFSTVFTYIFLVITIGVAISTVAYVVNTPIPQIEQLVAKDFVYRFPKLPEEILSRVPELAELSKITITVKREHIPFFCVFLSFAMIIFTKFPVIQAQIIQGNGNLNNAAPRKQQEKLTGWGARAVGAHNNAIEAFAPFAVAVIIATLAKVNLLAVNKICVLFIAARTLYHFLYLGNIHFLRTMVWAVGFSCCGALMLLSTVSFAY